MTRQRIPEEVLSAAHARARAREARQWAEADRLRAEIEAAGWRITDRGTDFALTPAGPPDVAEGDRIRYGSSASVPPRFDEPAIGLATVVLLATDWADDLDRTLAGLRTFTPVETSIVIVAEAPTAEQDARLRAMDAEAAEQDASGSQLRGMRRTEVVWTSERLGHAAATNIGLRRAIGPVVILLDTSVEPIGDFVTPLARAMEDPTIAVAGGWGIVSGDLRRFEDAPPGEVDAIEGYCQAFRRAEVASRGPLDEHFRFYRNLDIWWSLVLRDGGEGGQRRRAVSLADLPLRRHDHRAYTSVSDAERDRQSKRNFYRILDRFRDRRDLLIRPG